MTLLETHNLLLEAINNSKVLSTGQKKIMINLLQFDKGVPISVLIELMGQSKQALYFNVKKLLARGFITREKEMVFIYQVNKEKILELLESYIQLQKAKTFTSTKK
ncbi:MAG: helix-turn-helix transcriptional regulator [Rickettsiaceae bacterium]|nr:helix-turn-helix transcriptional regulator [Rickettsiaceae bacterium]MCP5378457.1 helix-turn-helix transcriptional regulator [Rickettsiaceae bacterium]